MNVTDGDPSRDDRGGLRASLGFYASALRTRAAVFVAAALSGAVAGAVSGFGAPYFIQKVFARFFEEGGPRLPFSEQVLVALALPALFLLRGGGVFLNQYLLTRVVQEFTAELRDRVFRRLQRLPLPFFERRASGDLIAGVVADTQQIQLVLVTIAKDLLLQPFIALGGLGYLVFLSVRERDVGFLLVLLVIMPFVLAPLRYVGRHLRHRSRQLADGFREITEHLAENLRGAVEVRAFGREEAEVERFAARNRGYVATALKLAKYYLLPQPAMEVLGVAVVSLGFLYAYRQGLSLATFAALGGALYFTVDSCKRLARLVNEIQRAEGSLRRVQALLDEPEAPDGASLPARRVERGEVRFEAVTFRYPEGEASALDSVAFAVRPGEVVALVGPSGAGKSTVFKLLQRFHEPTGGAVTVDGIDVREWRVADLRAGIALVPQFPVLFDCSVAENLRWGRPGATDAEVEAAARAAHAHEFIATLPNGYATRLGENAVRLSGGQRQRLAIARAFLRDAPILLLDEATSALDAESEALVQDALARLVKDRTVLLIAHRPSSIRLAHRVLVFERGRVTADGPPESVRAANAFFAQVMA